MPRTGQTWHLEGNEQWPNKYTYEVTTFSEWCPPSIEERADMLNVCPERQRLPAPWSVTPSHLSTH